MGPLSAIFDFKNNIPSICGLRIGESYDDYYEYVRGLQKNNTGDYDIDFVLKSYNAFIDVDTDDNSRINEIILTFNPLEPFNLKDMDNIVTYIRKNFDYSYRSDFIEQNWAEDPVEYNYKYIMEGNEYRIEVSKSDADSDVKIKVSSTQDDVSELQGRNVYYYHEPLGIYAVENSELGLSVTRHSGKLSREDVISNLIKAMKRDNEMGEDWYYGYAYSFLHQPGMIMPFEKELLEDEDYMRECAEEMTDVYGDRGGQAEEILSRAGVNEELIPIEEIFKEELLNGDITDFEEYLEEISYEWTLMGLLPYVSLDF